MKDKTKITRISDKEPSLEKLQKLVGGYIEVAYDDGKTQNKGAVHCAKATGVLKTVSSSKLFHDAINLLSFSRETKPAQE